MEDPIEAPEAFETADPSPFPPMLCPDPKPKRRFRTETMICVGCELETTYKFQVDADGALPGNFRQAVSPHSCFRCCSIAKCARDGDNCSTAFLRARGLSVESVLQISQCS